MAKRRIEVDIVANDQASSIFNKVKSNASSMTSSLMGALGGTVNAVGNLDKALRNYNSAMWRYNRVASSALRTAGDAVYNFTKDAINNFSALERQHAKTMGAMATEYGKTAEAQAKFLSDSEKLKKQALELGTVGPNGKGSLYNVTDVSYAQTALVKSGMSADDLLNTDAVSAILKFAGGNDLDVDTATTFAVNLATVFDKPVKEWGNMLDMVTKAADISVIDVQDIMDSLTYTGGIASGLNRDLEEVLGVISVMGQAGLRGRVAGTGLQAFFTRILSAGELSDTQIGNAPTQYVGQMYNAFTAEAINADGTFKNMDEVASLLDDAMGSLNDQEQAWFAKKLFGLYQMKAAYALTGAVDGDTNLITDYIDQIANQSQGTNTIKYELMQSSQYGKITSLQNAYRGIKTDIGSRMSPIVSAVADELFAFLANNGNYDINWDKLRNAIEESGDLIGEQYGEQLGKLIEDSGNLILNGGLIASALIPQAGGIFDGIVKLLNGDVTGALDAFVQGIEDTNDNIEDLPPELQDTAKAARNVITAFTVLSGVNLSTQILQIITTAFNTFVGKPIQAIKSLITATTATTNATTSTTNASTGTVNIGSVQLMNVNASVVNIYGPINGNPYNPPTGPSGGSPLLLPPTGPSGGSPLLLPGSGGGSANVPTGKVTDLYKFGGKYMTMSEILKTIGAKTGLLALAGASIGLLTSNGFDIFKSKDELAQGGSDWLDRYVQEKNIDYRRISGNSDVHYWSTQQDWYDKEDYSGDSTVAMVRKEMVGRTKAREEMMSYYKSDGGVAVLSDLFAQQIEQNGKITEEFLTSIMQWTKDGYTYTGFNEDIKEILDFMYENFDKDYKDSSSYYGRFNEAAINKFLLLDGGGVLNTPSKSNVMDVIDQAVYGNNNAIMQSSISSINNIANKIQNPNINISVTTNVDKYGNAKTNLDVYSEYQMSKINKVISKQTSRYGITHMEQ